MHLLPLIRCRASDESVADKLAVKTGFLEPTTVGMALVCPVGHPPGTGTPFCRLCGRPYTEVEDVPAEAAMGLLAAPTVRMHEHELRAASSVAVLAPPIPTQVTPAEPVSAPVTAPVTEPVVVPTVPVQAIPLAEPVDPAARPTVWVDPHPAELAPATSGAAPVTLHLPLVPSQAPAPTIAPTHANPLEPAVAAAIALSVREAVREAMLESAHQSATEGHEAAAPGVPARFDRTVMLATAAGVVGGLVSSAGLSFLLG